MIQLDKYDFRSTSEEREALLKQVKKSGIPGVLIHTCNRVEFYHGQGEIPMEAVNHLFRVVSGLESFFIGETFIQGQIKEQYYESISKFKIDASLHRLFQWALRTGKRVRSETALSRGAMSHSQAVVEIIRNTIPDFAEKRFAFIGINKLNKTIMNFLRGNINNSFVLCNRTFERARELENEFNCKAFKLDHLKLALEQSDIIISATSAPHTIIRQEHLPFAHQLTIFDLASPSDADLKVQHSDRVNYYSIGKIEEQVEKNKNDRTEEVAKAEIIIAEELFKFQQYQHEFLKRKQNAILHKELTH
jgi:glutamyl-tRNA reductase